MIRSSWFCLDPIWFSRTKERPKTNAMTYCSIVARRDSENSRFKRNTYVYNLCPDTNLKIRIHARNKQLGQDFLWDVSLYLKKTSHFIVAVTQSAALNGKVLALIAGFAIKSNNNLPSRHILLSFSFEISYSFPSTCPVSSTPNFKTRGALENSVDVVLSEAFFVLFCFVFCLTVLMVIQMEQSAL